jgi:CelD/BcsL family acetyltransferase involved in cellulose biosynthesis
MVANMDDNHSHSTGTQQHSPPTELKGRIIRNVQQWEALANCWDSLLAASSDSNPWQSWSYLWNWWQYLSAKHQLYVVVVESAGHPQLVMPLQLSRVRMLGLPVKALEPIGMWSDVNRPRLALGENRSDYYECAFATLTQHQQDWDLIRIDEKLLDNYEVLQMQRYCNNNAHHFRHIFSHLCPYLDLRQEWDSFLGKRGSKMRKNLRAARKRLESRGRVELRIHTSPAEIEAGFELVLALHKRSWKRRKKIEHSASPRYQAFYQNWLRDMSNQGKARILSLHCEDQPVAATIAFLNGSTYHSAQIVHAAEFNHCSPGTLLEALELEELMTNKAFTHYDFLGSFLNNKMRWTNTAHSTSVVFALRDTMKNRLIDRYYFDLKPRAKRMMHHIKTSLQAYASKT